MTFTDAQFLSLLEAWLWPFLRIGGLLMAAPVFGTRTVPNRVRLVFALAITAVLVPVLPPHPAYAPLSGQGIIVSVNQVVIGVSMGLVARLMFAVLEFAGQLVAQQMGLGFAALVDPQSGAQVPDVSQLYTILATLVFLALGGHLLLLELLGESFTLLPVGPDGLSANALELFLGWAGRLFSAAVLIALPIIVALLAVNIAFGVMARAAPQLNIFAIGFPIMIMLGIGTVFLTLGNLDAHMRASIDDALRFTHQLLTTR